MLTVQIGAMDNAIYAPFVYFDNTNKYDIAEWFKDDFVKEMVKDVDKSEVLSPYCIMSPVFGQIPPMMLSGGVKTLILILKEPETVFNASKCGDNCAKWLLKIAERNEKEGRDTLINLRHIMDFGPGQFEIKIVNTNEIVHNMDEFVDVAHECLLRSMGK